MQVLVMQVVVMQVLVMQVVVCNSSVVLAALIDSWRRGSADWEWGVWGGEAPPRQELNVRETRFFLILGSLWAPFWRLWAPFWTPLASLAPPPGRLRRLGSSSGWSWAPLLVHLRLHAFFVTFGVLPGGGFGGYPRRVGSMRNRPLGEIGATPGQG